MLSQHASALGLPDRGNRLGASGVLSLLRHWRHGPLFTALPAVRRPCAPVELKPVARMQAAPRGQKVETCIHKGKTGFFENAARGWVLDAGIGENPVRPRQTEDRVDERRDGLGREPPAPERRRENIADFDSHRRDG